MLAIGLILLLIFFMRTITRFVSPLNQLVRQSQYIASGHFGEPMARTRRTDRWQSRSGNCNRPMNGLRSATGNCCV